MAKRAKFSSKIGLIMATVGSAVGLGNIWRFPSEVHENGGAAFVLIYLVCLCVLGIPVMMAEFALGRGGKSDILGVFKNAAPNSKYWWLVGVLAVLVSYMILSFYMVVAGWSFEYLGQSITGGLFDGLNETEGTSLAFFAAKMGETITSSFNPLYWTYAMIIINLVVLLKGVNKGIERISNMLMPFLFLILLLFCVVSLSLPNSMEGVRFFLKPEWSAVNIDTVIFALGQAFFSLSLGMGILLTYSAYFPSTTHLLRTATSVATLDFVVAFLMGLIVFPAACSFGMTEGGHGLDGATLVFVTLPEIFSKMPVSQLWSILFFFLLTIAALTSTIALGEVAIALVEKRMKLSRVKATLLVILPLFLFSSICSLSQGPLSHILIAGRNIFDFLDLITTNIMLPTSAILVCIFMGWVVPKSFFRNQATSNGRFKAREFPIIYTMVKYVSPILILLIMLFKIVEIIN
ncbi:MAG: sodium-dependent transporter [Bacteroidales bacterium]